MQSTMSGGPTVVFFDLECTGLDTSACDITQLAAISGQLVYSVYILPRCSITREASRITGLTVCGNNLLLNGAPVPTVPLRQALLNFITFLQYCNQPLLAAHNAKRFDCLVLARLLEECSLKQQFQEVVYGFLDTFLISKIINPTLEKHSLVYLVSHFLGKSYNAHNALDDATALKELFYVWNLPRDLSIHIFQLPCA